MRETLLITMIFLLGCAGLLSIYLSANTISDYPETDDLTRRITYIVPSSEAGCVQIDLNLQSHPESTIHVDYGNGMSEKYDGKPLVARYQNPGIYLVRAYQNGKLVDINECRILGQSY